MIKVCSYRIYPYLTEDEMTVHQWDIKNKLKEEKLNYFEVYAGPKDLCSFKIGKTDKFYKLSSYIVVLRIEE